MELKGFEVKAWGSAELRKQAVIVQTKVSLALAHLRLFYMRRGELFRDGARIGEMWKHRAEQGFESGNMTRRMP